MRTLLNFVLLALLAGSAPIFGQSDNALLRQLAEDNKKSVEALALYPPDTRLAILESAQYPEVLIKMNNAREKTAAAFRALLEDAPRQTQEVLFDLTRFPELLTELVGHRNDAAAQKKALTVLPENKRNTAFDVVRQNPDVLEKINALQRTADAAFEQMTAAYPAPARAAFRRLTALPEVLDILNQDLRFTVLVGEEYRANPARVIHKVDSLNLVVARTHAQEVDDWKAEIENDPEAGRELQAAAKDYAAAYGYTDDLYADGNDDLYAEPEPWNAPVYQTYYGYSYSYWFGYPWWTPEPCWRPYPFWWYWGFYPVHQTIVIVQLPSYHFMHWYFGEPWHHHSYNHLSTHFVEHYYGYRHTGTSISVGVGEWRDRNREILSDAWLQDKSRLPERLNEYARFEQGRETFNRKNPARTLTATEYLDQNSTRYPELQRSRTAAQTEVRSEQIEQDRQRAEWAPTRERVPNETPPPVQKPRIEQPKPDRRDPVEQKPPVTRPERPATQPARKPDIEEAKDYHREKWEAPRQRTPQPAPATKPQTTPTRKEKPQAPRTNPAPQKQKQREG